MMAAVAVSALSLMSRHSPHDFVGLGEARLARQPDLCGRCAGATGRTRQSPDVGVDDLWKVDPQTFKYGWDQEEGRWYDIPKNMIKLWWQRPGYLTPYGYRQPPHWNKKDYELCCTEMRMGKIEADLVKVLKDRGMSIEEIRAKSSVYEFVENTAYPKMTPKFMFLMQVKCLYDGVDKELLDPDEVFKAYEREEGAPEPKMSVWVGPNAGMLKRDPFPLPQMPKMPWDKQESA